MRAAGGALGEGGIRVRVSARGLRGSSLSLPRSDETDDLSQHGWIDAFDLCHPQGIEELRAAPVSARVRPGHPAQLGGHVVEPVPPDHVDGYASPLALLSLGDLLQLAS